MTEADAQADGASARNLGSVWSSAVPLSSANDADQVTIALLHGPNLNLLGTRQPEVYGTATLADHVTSARRQASVYGLSIVDLQSNRESDLIEAIHRLRGRSRGLIINPGAFTHYSWGLHDALAAYDPPIVELHLSNPASRESFRHLSVVAPVATATIAGLGGAGYRLAVDAMAALIGVSAPV